MGMNARPQYARMICWQVSLFFFLFLLGQSQRVSAQQKGMMMTPNPARVGETVTLTTDYVNYGYYYDWYLDDTPYLGYGLFSITHRFFHHLVEKSYHVRLVVYDFNWIPVYTKSASLQVRNVFTITINGTQGGTASASGATLNGVQGDGIRMCAADSPREACQETYLQGTSMSLIATPEPGWWFVGWLDRDKHVMIEQRELPIFVAENRTLEPIFLSVNAISLYQPTCQEQADVWSDACQLPWEDVILYGDPVRVKVEFSREIPSFAQTSAIKAFSDVLEISVFSDPAQSVWNKGGDMLKQSDVRIVTENGVSELRITIPWELFEAYKLLPSQPKDSIGEFISADIVTDQLSSFNDGNAFDSNMKTTFEGRGNARKNTYISPSMNGDEKNLLSPISLSIMKAGGVQFFKFRVSAKGNIFHVSSVGQIQNQADYLYYSGHGARDGRIASGLWSPELAREFWKSDLDTLIFAGCSVLTINDYARKWLYRTFYHPTKRDPNAEEVISQTLGDRWRQSNPQIEGPKLFLGYQYLAPRDVTQKTDEIITDWVKTSRDADSWMDVNRKRRWLVRQGLNACAIDFKAIPWTYQFFWDNKLGMGEYPKEICDINEKCTIVYDEQEKRWSPLVTYSDDMFIAILNSDNSIATPTPITITVTGDKWSGKNGDDLAVNNKNVQIKNLPNGLIVHMKRINDWQLSAIFDGEIQNPSNVYNLQFIFQSSAFQSGKDANSVIGYERSKLIVEFY